MPYLSRAIIFLKMNGDLKKKVKKERSGLCQLIRRVSYYSPIILSLALTVSIFLKTARALLRELLGKLTNSSLRTFC